MLNKPAGMVVHPGAGHASGTLVNALLHHLTDLSGIGGELRPGIVHRLDRGTSGVMVVAKNDARASGAGAAVPRSRGREGIHRARLGRRAGRPAHRRGDRPRPGQPAEDVGARQARARGGDAHHAGASPARAHALPGRDPHRPDASDPRAPERHRPSDRRRLAVRRRAPARAGRHPSRAAARAAVPARRAAGVHASDASSGAWSSSRRCPTTSKRVLDGLPGWPPEKKK